jgi:hypothetical protein
MYSVNSGKTSTKKATQFSMIGWMDGEEKPAFRHSMSRGGGASRMIGALSSLGSSFDIDPLMLGVLACLDPLQKAVGD